MKRVSRWVTTDNMEHKTELAALKAELALIFSNGGRVNTVHRDAVDSLLKNAKQAQMLIGMFLHPKNEAANNEMVKG